MKNKIYSAATFFLGFSISSLIMVEYGFTSIFANWNPTHDTAIASGIISIAFATLANGSKQ